MPTAYVVVTILAAAWVSYSAASLLLRSRRLVKFLIDYGVPDSWWPWLGTAKAAGAAGLVVGLFVPVVGVMAEIGLVVYFIGAIVTVVRARWYSHIPFPVMYLAPVVASAALRLAA
jgi:DoxX-like family